MKQWTVYFRDKNGSKASVVVEAEDRAGVFAELKKRGISAISVTEGASNKKPRKVAKNSASSKGRGLIVAAIVVVAGAVAWLSIRTSSELIDNCKVKELPLTSAVSSRTNSNKIARVTPKKNEVLRKKTRREELLNGLDTNKWKYVKNPLTGEEYVSRVFRPTAFFESKRLYANQALNEIDAIMFGDMSDPLVGITIDDRFLDHLGKAFINGVEEKVDDDEETKFRRAEMKEALAMLKKALKDGENITDMVNESLKEHRKVAALKEQMREERRMMRDEGASEDEIEAFEDICNKRLQEFGASPMITRRIASERLRAIQMKKEQDKKGVK
jgi:hypothetical protein